MCRLATPRAERSACSATQRSPGALRSGPRAACTVAGVAAVVAGLATAPDGLRNYGEAPDRAAFRRVLRPDMCVSYTRVAAAGAFGLDDKQQLDHPGGRLPLRSDDAVFERQAGGGAMSVDGLGDPKRTNAQQLSEALEMSIVMQDVQPRALCCDGDRQIGERQSMGSMRAGGRKLSHG